MHELLSRVCMYVIRVNSRVLCNRLPVSHRLKNELLRSGSELNSMYDYYIAATREPDCNQKLLTADGQQLIFKFSFGLRRIIVFSPYSIRYLSHDKYPQIVSTVSMVKGA